MQFSCCNLLTSTVARPNGPQFILIALGCVNTSQPHSLYSAEPERFVVHTYVHSISGNAARILSSLSLYSYLERCSVRVVVGSLGALKLGGWRVTGTRCSMLVACISICRLCYKRQHHRCCCSHVFTRRLTFLGLLALVCSPAL
ncbi:unnamed protein product [Ceratitis capitata]|uniref:(Mediterranean fruit fly) hypothetical protein n=1 Tax=Ceratitis capitata TaxID=7213 RepID=A0A811VA16_CERCA|nr:unnamed protein product [Ceratitis capitata]